MKNKEINNKFEDINEKYNNDRLLLKQYVSQIDRLTDENKRLKDSIDNYKKQMNEIHRRHSEVIKREKIAFENNTNKLTEEYLSKIGESYNNSEL